MSSEVKYVLPDQNQMKIDYFLKYKEVFLSLNGLKVGDTVTLPFEYEYLRTQYKKRSMSKYSGTKICEGVLKETEQGFLYAESNEFLPFYKEGSRGGWVEQQRKSQYKFGESVTFFHSWVK